MPRRSIEDLFHRARELPPEQRSEFLANECGDDQELRAELISLLHARGANSQLLQIAPTDPLEGTKVGSYQIEKLLDRGGQGTVYLAHHEQSQEPIAIKFLSPELATDPAARSRLRREAEATMRLEHPGICKIRELGDHQGTPYLAMAFVEGESLKQLLTSTRYPPQSSAAEDEATVPMAGASVALGGATTAEDRIDQLVEFFERAAHALDHAHEAGLIHRDIKPGNIMVGTDGNPVLLDFGLVRDLETSETALTHSGDILGTPQYMSPEQIQGSRRLVDRRSDIYSLGATMFECLALRRPFEADNPHDLQRMVTTLEPPSVRAFNREVPQALARVLDCAMERNPRHRYQSGREFAEALRRVREGATIPVNPARWLRRRLRWIRRHAAPVSLGAAVVATTLTVLLTPSAPGPPELVGERWRSNTDAYAHFLNGWENYWDSSNPARASSARRQFEQALELDADYSPALAGMAYTYARELQLEGIAHPDRLTEALALARRAQELDDTLAIAWRAEGEVLYQQGNLESARDALRQALDRNPQLAEVYGLLGQVYAGLGDSENAIWSFTQGIEVQPDRPSTYALFSRFHRANDDDDQAEAVLDQGLVALPENPFLLVERAQMLRARKRESEAVSLYERILGDHPDHFPAYPLLMAAQRGLGRQASADSVCERMLQRWPENSNVAFRGADHFYRSRNFARAEELYRRAIDLDPLAFTARADLSNTLIALGRVNDARNELETLVDRWPTSGEACVRFATFLYRTGKIEEAESWAERAVEVDPSSAARAYGLLQYIHSRASNWERASDAARRLIEVDADNVEAHYIMALSSIELGHFQEAVEAGEAAVRLSPRNAGYHSLLGDAYFETMRLNHAAVAYDQATELSTGHARAAALMARADVYTYEGRYEQAIEANEKAALADSADAGPWSEIAKIAWFHLRDADRAEQAAKRAIAREVNTDSSALAWTVLARVANAQGSSDEARTCYHRAKEAFDAVLSESPDASWVWPTAGRLYAYTGQHTRARELAQSLAATGTWRSFRGAVPILGLLGEFDQAVACLDSAIIRGYNDVRSLRRDPDLATLRENEAFAARIATIE